MIDPKDDEEPDAAELFNALPSPLASHYGQRAEEIEFRLRSAGIIVAFDMPGEGFTLQNFHGEPIERANLRPELRPFVDELEQITNA